MALTNQMNFNTLGTKSNVFFFFLTSIRKSINLDSTFDIIIDILLHWLVAKNIKENFIRV